MTLLLGEGMRYLSAFLVYCFSQRDVVWQCLNLHNVIFCLFDYVHALIIETVNHQLVSGYSVDFSLGTFLL